MARIEPISPSQVNQEINAIFEEIEEAFGMVPNIFRTYARHPPLLRANWNKVKALLMEGSLSRKLKETIAVLVSGDNSCQYCVTAHSAVMKAIGLSDEEIAAIKEDLDLTDFDAKEKALIRFARKANLSPHRIEEDELTLLRQKGATDAEIIEALGIMEIFTAFNKFLDSLQVEIDF